ncbi:MAG: iron ABC transporter permease [Niameybacter sp.]|uniref:ABC transporter permease n=1 Tax=Niameybacter sp. TaxID=2033640 RepID=UPI002FC7E28C
MLASFKKYVGQIRLDFWTVVKIVVIAILALFLIYPFSSLIYRSFFNAEVQGFTLQNYKDFFTLPYYYNTLKNSLYVCVVTTVITICLGVPLAYVMTRYNIYGKKLINIFIIMSLMSPPFIGAYSWIMLFGRSGFITQLVEEIGITMPPIYGKLGIIMVFVMKLFPYIYLYVSGAMSSIDRSLEEAAENLGASKWRRLRTITLPVVLPSIAAGAIPVYLLTLVAILPQIVVIVTSFINTNGPIFVKGFGLESYKNIWYRLSSNITNTYLFATVAIVIIIIMGMLISYIAVRQKGKVGVAMDLLIMFPYVIPGAVLGIGLLTAFNNPPLLLTGTPFIMIAAYVVRKLPYTVRSGSAFLQQVDPSIEEASINLGVSPRRTFFKITARMMLPGICSGAILSWIACINELSSSIMLYTGKTSTISVAIYTEVVRNSFGTGAALASILTMTTVVSLLIFMKLSKGKVSII